MSDKVDKSPFPGIDPYLEGEMWQEFHQTLANQIRGQLIPLVRPKYVALQQFPLWKIERQSLLRTNTKAICLKYIFV